MVVAAAMERAVWAKNAAMSKQVHRQDRYKSRPANSHQELTVTERPNASL
jgi:hypothetical protein